ncbi:MAG: hypothetical protein ACYS76_07575 [Planctomycetota bacterium]|jgi:hypothetical protein
MGVRRTQPMLLSFFFLILLVQLPVGAESKTDNLGFFSARGPSKCRMVRVSVHVDSVRLCGYRITEAGVRDASFELEWEKAFVLSGDGGRLVERLLPRSVAVYSTYKLRHCDAGTIAD